MLPHGRLRPREARPPKRGYRGTRPASQAARSAWNAAWTYHGSAREAESGSFPFPFPSPWTAGPLSAARSPTGTRARRHRRGSACARYRPSCRTCSARVRVGPAAGLWARPRAETPHPPRRNSVQRAQTAPSGARVAAEDAGGAHLKDGGAHEQPTAPPARIRGERGRRAPAGRGRVQSKLRVGPTPRGGGVSPLSFTREPGRGRRPRAVWRRTWTACAGRSRLEFRA